MSRPTFRKLLIGLGSAALSLFVLILVLPLVLSLAIPWGRLEAKLSDQIEASIGRRLVVDGSISLKFMPWPTVRVRDVSLADPVSETDAEAMVQAEQVLLKIDLAAIFSGDWGVSLVTLISPDINLTRFADGTANWSFVGQVRTGTGGFDNGAADLASTLRANAINIVGGNVTYHDAGTGFTRKFFGLNAAITAQTLSGPFNAEGDIAVGNTIWQYRLGVDTLTEGMAVPVGLNFGALGADIDFSGVLSGYPENPRLSGSISGDAQDALAFFLAAGINAEGDNVRSGRRGSFDGVINATEKTILVEQLTAQVGTIDGRGELRIDFGEPSNVSLLMTVGTMDFDAFQEAVALQEELLAPSRDAEAENTLRRDAGLDTGPRPFALPTGFSMSVDAVVDDLIYRGQQANDLGFSMHLANGRATFNELSVLLPSGALLSFDGDLEALDGEAYLDGRLGLEGPNFAALLKWLGASRYGVGPLLPGKPFKSQSEIERIGGVTRFENIRGDIGGTDLSGRLNLGREAGLDALFTVGSVALTSVAKGQGSEFEMNFAISNAAAPEERENGTGFDFDIRGEVEGEREQMTVDVTARLAGAELNLVGDDIDFDALDGDLEITATHSDFGAFVRRVAPNLQMLALQSNDTVGRALNLEGKISLDDGKIEIYDLGGAIGDITLGGGAEISSQDERVKITSLLETGPIPLAWFALPFFIDASRGGQNGLGEIGAQFVSPWPTDLFDTERLTAMDFELGVDAEALLYNGLILEDGHLDLAVLGGALDLRTLEGDFLGGHATTSGSFVGGGDEPPSAFFRARLTGIEAGRLSEIAALQQDGGGWISALISPLVPGVGLDLSGGTIEIEVDLSAAGESPADMAQTLVGRSVTVFEGVAVNGVDSCEIAAILSSGPTVSPVDEVVANQASPATLLAPFIIQINVEEGTGILNAPEISADCATAQLAGAIDFAARRIDFVTQVGFVGRGEDGGNLPNLEFAQSGAFGDTKITLINRDEIAAFGRVEAEEENELAPSNEVGSEVGGEVEGGPGAQVPRDAFRSLIENLLR